MVSFEIFVKAMLPSLSELKVLPSFCFAFKIPDNRELEMSADGTMADESKLDILGVIEGLKPGETGQLVIDDLPAGTYAFICNTPGHYSEEMVYKIIAR